MLDVEGTQKMDRDEVMGVMDESNPYQMALKQLDSVAEIIHLRGRYP